MDNILDKAVCKYCGSTSVRRFGWYKDTQLYFCNDCRRKFTPIVPKGRVPRAMPVGECVFARRASSKARTRLSATGFARGYLHDSLFHMKTPASHVSSALDMYYKGLSLNEIREHLQQEYDNTPSSSTVFKWVDKYTGEAVKETDKYHPKVGGIWIADETYVRVDRHSRGQSAIDNPYNKSKKAKWIVFWDIIDADTRFLLASHITTTRGTEDARILMETAARRAGKLPRAVVTDKLAAYLDGIELAYGASTRHGQGGPFDVVNNTNLIERFHGTIKERTKVMRGLRTSETAKRFLDGWMVYYNYMKPHESLNSKTPAEAAKCDYTFRDWADLTRSAEPQVKVLVTPAKVEVLPDKPVAKFRVATRPLRKKRRVPRRESAVSLSVPDVRRLPTIREKMGGAK